LLYYYITICPTIFGDDTLVALSITFSFITEKYLLILFLLHIIPSGIEEFPNFDCNSSIVSLLAAYIDGEGL